MLRQKRRQPRVRRDVVAAAHERRIEPQHLRERRWILVQQFAEPVAGLPCIFVDARRDGRDGRRRPRAGVRLCAAARPPGPAQGAQPGFAGFLGSSPSITRPRAEKLTCSTTMKDDDPDEVTVLLGQWRQGSPEAQEKLMVMVQSELRRLAASYLRRERPGHTLQPTAVVNEAYMRLMPQRGVRWENRAHFFGIAAKMMRRVLVDHARRKRAGKREGFSGEPVSVSAGAGSERRAGHRRAQPAPGARRPGGARSATGRGCRAALLRRVEDRGDCGSAIGVSQATVKRELTTATVWLKHRMKGEKT